MQYQKSRLWLYGEMTLRTLPHFPCSCRRLFAGRYFGARGSHIDAVILRRPRVCPSIVERGEATGVDFDTDIAGAEGYTLEWFPRAARFAGTPFDVAPVHVVHVTAARSGKPAEVLWPS
jgi:hypothetical protein